MCDALGIDKDTRIRDLTDDEVAQVGNHIEGTPVIGIALILTAVFVPVAFIPGLTGRTVVDAVLAATQGFAPGAGMQFDELAARARCRLNLRRVGRDEQAHVNARVVHALARLGDRADQEVAAAAHHDSAGTGRLWV